MPASRDWSVSAALIGADAPPGAPTNARGERRAIEVWIERVRPQLRLFDERRRVIDQTHATDTTPVHVGKPLSVGEFELEPNEIRCRLARRDTAEQPRRPEMHDQHGRCAEIEPQIFAVAPGCLERPPIQPPADRRRAGASHARRVGDDNARDRSTDEAMLNDGLKARDVR